MFVCLFVGIKPDKLYSASCVGRIVNPLGVITHGLKKKEKTKMSNINWCLKNKKCETKIKYRRVRTKNDISLGS